MLLQPDADQARSALRARLQDIIERRQIPEAALEGAKMRVAGPIPVTDPAGRTWYEWVATLKTRPIVPGEHPSEDADARPTVDDFGLLRRRAG